MAVLRISVGSGAPAGDYTSLDAWWVSRPSTLTEAETAQVRFGTSANEVRTSSSLTGKTCGVHRVTIEGYPGEAFNDSAGKLTNALRYNASNGAAIRPNDTGRGIYFANDVGARITVRDLQLAVADGYPWDAQLIRLDDVSDSIVERCVLSADEHSYGPQAMVQIGGAGNVGPLVVRDCVFIKQGWLLDPTPDTVDAIRIGAGAGNEQVHVIGNTLLNIGVETRTRGINIINSRSHVVHNNLVLGFGTDISKSGATVAESNNATDRSAGSTGFGATGRQVDVVEATTLTNVAWATADARLLSGAAKAINLGWSAAASATDALGQSRSGGTADIGAFEFQSAFTSLALKLQHHGAFT
jgi:hypothetical protein